MIMRGFRGFSLWKNAARRSSTLCNAGDNLVCLHNSVNGSEIYLLGTVHISRTSARLVKELIHTVKPNIVAVELCLERAIVLFDEEEISEEDTSKQGIIREFLDCPGGFREKTLHVLLSFFYRMLHDAGMEPAKEFKVAHSEALKVGAEVHLIDQEMKVTRERVSRTLTMPVAFKLIRKLTTRKEFDVIYNAVTKGDTEAIEKLNSREFVTRVIQQLHEEFPQVIEALVHERDEIMTKRLLSCEGKIVAVVGLAHVDGIEKRWNAYKSEGGYSGQYTSVIYSY